MADKGRKMMENETISRADGDIRVVVVGHDAERQGVVVRDHLVGPWALPAAGYAAHILWGTDSPGALCFPDDGLQATFSGPVPPVGGLRFAVLLVPPDQSAGQAEASPPQDSPGMDDVYVVEGDLPNTHFTPTLDLAVVLEGEVIVALDKNRHVHLKAGECIIQQGARHSWLNPGDKMAKVAVAVMGVRHQSVQRAESSVA
jgi:mannose-6-phosphate isomerase-like protein (cupin superfamily)